MQTYAPRIVGPKDGKAGFLGSIGVRFMIPGADTSENFSLVEHPMSPRALAAPLHLHSREEWPAEIHVQTIVDIGAQRMLLRLGACGNPFAVCDTAVIDARGRSDQTGTARLQPRPALRAQNASGRAP